MTHNFRVGEELGPVRSGCTGLGFSQFDRWARFSGVLHSLRVKQVRKLDKMTVV